MFEYLGEVKTGSLVPWEVQLVNTLPDNFLWEKEKTVILVVAPGLYEVLHFIIVAEIFCIC